MTQDGSAVKGMPFPDEPQVGGRGAQHDCIRPGMDLSQSTSVERTDVCVEVCSGSSGLS